MEFLDLIDLLARRDDLDRHASDGTHRERRATARIAIELRQDQTVEGDRGLEVLRRHDRVLAGHAVEHEQRVGRANRVADLDEFAHQVLINRQAASGVDDDDIATLLLGLLDTPLRDLDRVHVGATLVDGYTGLRADGDELLDCGRAIDVAGHQRGLLALLGNQLGELRAGRRLAGALEAADEDHGRVAGE